MAMTPYYQTATLNLLTGAYVALHTGAPGATGSSNECTDTAYHRQALTFAAPADGDADGIYTITNSAEIDYAAMLSAQTISYFSLWSAATGGDCYITVPLNSPKALAIGGVARFPIGELIVKGVTA